MHSPIKKSVVYIRATEQLVETNTTSLDQYAAVSGTAFVNFANVHSKAECVKYLNAFCNNGEQLCLHTDSQLFCHILDLALHRLHS